MIWKDDRVAQTKTNSFGYDNLGRLTLVTFSDAAGRMTADASKGISSITWNVLGQPQTVTFIDGATVSYLYAADGTKLREIRTGTGTTARCYFVRDHLGSVRAVVNDSGTSLETDDYYPLGGPLPTGSSTTLQPEKYQGKDWNATSSFNVYDFGARLYDPALGRWLSQDPLAEKYYAHSPYLFCAGDPVRFVDPSGEKIVVRHINEDNTFTEYEWQEKDDEWGFYDAEGNLFEGVDEYMHSVGAALSALMEGENGSKRAKFVFQQRGTNSV